LSNVERDGGDGVITRLGIAVSQLPLGVRYAKMLLVAAQAGILDYAIVAVAVLSEASPFSNSPLNVDETDPDDVDKTLTEKREGQAKTSKRWYHSSGDVFAAILALGAYTYAGKGAGGASESLASRKFCDENGLNHTIMKRIQKLRSHIASISKKRLPNAKGVAAATGGISHKMSPPDKVQELLLVQSIASGLLDKVALLSTPGSISGDYPIDLRSAYIGCRASSKDPLFLDKSSVVYTRDYRQLPRWICYDSLVRKTAKDGTSIVVMKNVTTMDPHWMGELSKDTRLVTYGTALSTPPPIFDADRDAVLCSVTTKYGSHGWEIPPVKMIMYDVLHCPLARSSPFFHPDDSFRWFARFLWEGKVIKELGDLHQFLNDSPSLITRNAPSSKVSMLVTSLSRAGVDSAAALRKHWADVDDKFLYKNLKSWINREHYSTAKSLWIDAVRQNIKRWKENRVCN
jgi:hypothetical protein